MLVTWCQVGWGGENDPQESADLMEEEEGAGGGGREGSQILLEILGGYMSLGVLQRELWVLQRELWVCKSWLNISGARLRAR